MDTAIVMFTRDLRLHDNPALHQACQQARHVVPLFVADPAIDAGARSPNRARFLAESLADLRGSLRERGADLVLRHGDPAAEVVKLATEVNASMVYLAGDVSHYATARREKLTRACDRHRIGLTLTPGLTVVPPAELAPAGGGHYRVFTPYWRAWRAATWRTHCPVPPVITMPGIGRTGDLPVAGTASPGLAPGGETAGRHRFVTWRQRLLAGYAGHHDQQALDAWRAGQTGIPVVDAGMRQLAAEGFMHNRARMITASFLTRNLGIDWRHGYAHFASLLADGDLACNAGNWQWVAGTGNNTRPDRVMNPLRQAQRFDKTGDYVRRYVPELAGLGPAHVHTPWQLPAMNRPRYPDPIAGLP